VGATTETDLLSTPDRGGCQVLVHPRLENDLMLAQIPFRLPKREIVASQRRAAVAGDETRSVEPGGSVTHALQHRQPDQGRRAGDIDAAGLECVFVVERDLGELRGCASQACALRALQEVEQRVATRSQRPFALLVNVGSNSGNREERRCSRRQGARPASAAGGGKAWQGLGQLETTAPA